MTRGKPRPDGKVLIIGGGIANFTNVAATFKGEFRFISLRKVGKGKVEGNGWRGGVGLICQRGLAGFRRCPAWRLFI